MIQQRVMQALVLVLCALYAASASATPCPRPCKCFAAENGILSANCTDLPDQTTAAWPQKILRVHFDSPRTSPIMLKNKAFKHFPQLTLLDITGGTVQYVGNSAFDGLPDLIELNLVGTAIRKLHRNTFATNRKLAFLSLKNNPRLFIAPSFIVSESITELDLSECALGTLKSVYFKSLPNLKYLFAMKNELKSLGSQFGPPGLKYVNLADNYIENVYEDLDAYKRLRTIDLTRNPINCTCELLDIDKKLTARGVAFGNTITCKQTGKSLGDMVEICTDQEMMGDDPVDIYKADNLLKIDKNTIQSMDDIDDSGSGSGSGDGEFNSIRAQTEIVQITTTQPTENVKTSINQVENVTQVENAAEENATLTDGIEFDVITKTNATEVFAEPNSTEPEVQTTITQEPTVGNVSSSGETTEETSAADVVVNVEPAVPGNNSSTARSGADGGIVPLTIQAPEDEQDVQKKVAEYLKSNVGITGTAVILAVVIVAIVYKAVCLGRSRRHNSMASDKVVELKEIKYSAANTEDVPPPPANPAEENLLGDRGGSDGTDDDEDDDGDEGHAGTAAAVAPDNNGGLPQNGLSNGFGNAAKPGGDNDPRPPATPKAEVPTRVIVRLAEIPKASKPVTINNVH